MPPCVCHSAEEQIDQPISHTQVTELHLQEEDSLKAITNGSKKQKNYGHQAETGHTLVQLSGCSMNS